MIHVKEGWVDVRRGMGLKGRDTAWDIRMLKDEVEGRGTERTLTNCPCRRRFSWSCSDQSRCGQLWRRNEEDALQLPRCRRQGQRGRGQCTCGSESLLQISTVVPTLMQRSAPTHGSHALADRSQDQLARQTSSMGSDGRSGRCSMEGLTVDELRACVVVR